MHHARDLLYHLEELCLAALLEELLELKGGIEVVLDGGFAHACHDYDLGGAGFFCHLDPVLDKGLVHKREHFLWNSLRRREEPRPEACGREDRLLYLHSSLPHTHTAVGVFFNRDLEL